MWNIHERRYIPFVLCFILYILQNTYLNDIFYNFTPIGHIYLTLNNLFILLFMWKKNWIRFYLYFFLWSIALSTENI